MGPYSVQHCYTLFRGPLRRTVKDQLMEDPCIDVPLPRKPDLRKTFDDVLSAHEVDRLVDAIADRSPGYASLKTNDRYEALVFMGAWLGPRWMHRTSRGGAAEALLDSDPPSSSMTRGGGGRGAQPGGQYLPRVTTYAAEFGGPCPWRGSRWSAKAVSCWKTVMTDDPIGKVRAARVSKELLRQPARRAWPDPLQPSRARCLPSPVPHRRRRRRPTPDDPAGGTIEEWWPGIEAFLQLGVTNARTEGCHGVVKHIKQVARASATKRTIKGPAAAQRDPLGRGHA